MASALAPLGNQQQSTFPTFPHPLHIQCSSFPRMKMSLVQIVRVRLHSRGSYVVPSLQFAWRLRSGMQPRSGSNVFPRTPRHGTPRRAFSFSGNSHALPDDRCKLLVSRHFVRSHGSVSVAPFSLLTRPIGCRAFVCWLSQLSALARRALAHTPPVYSTALPPPLKRPLAVRVLCIH